MANDIAQKLVRGSKNIDRMKAEVWMVIQMILGFVQCWEPKSLTFGTSTCRWSVELYDHHRLVGDDKVTCLVRDSPESEGGRYAFDSFTYTGRWAVNSMKDVESVYDSLYAFVEGMLCEFPELEQEIAPILKASSKFPSAQ